MESNARDPNSQIRHLKFDIRHLPHLHPHPAPLGFACRRYDQASRDALAEFADVGDDADGPAGLGPDAVECIHDRLQQLRVEYAEAFVEDEESERGAPELE